MLNVTAVSSRGGTAVAVVETPGATVARPAARATPANRRPTPRTRRLIVTTNPTAPPSSRYRLRGHSRELAAGDVEHLAVHVVGPRRAEEEHASRRLLRAAR